MSELIREKLVKTRKDHICFGCGRLFPAGTNMSFNVTAEDGVANNFYLCDTCQDVVADWAREEGGHTEFGYGDTRDTAIEYERSRSTEQC